MIEKAELIKGNDFPYQCMIMKSSQNLEQHKMIEQAHTFSHNRIHPGTPQLQSDERK